MSHSKSFGDRYTMAAAKRFGVRPEKVTKEQRTEAKREYYREMVGLNDDKNTKAK